MRRTMVFAFFSCLIGCTAHFTPLPDAEPPKVITRRAKLDNFTSYGDHPELLPGRVLMVAKKDGKCPTDRIFDADYISLESYLKEDAKVEPKTLSNLLYQGALKKGGNLDVVAATFNSNVAGAVAAEVIVTDVREAMGENLLDATKIKTLEETMLPSDLCSRILVKNARVALVHYKLYQEASSKLDFTGTAFGVGNNIYNSNNQFQADIVVTMDIARLKSPGPKAAVDAENAPEEQVIIRAAKSLQLRQTQ